MIYFLTFAAAFLATTLFAMIVRKLALKQGVLDNPTLSRKIHDRPTPLLGGLAVIASFDIVSAILYFSLPLLNQNIPLSSMLAIWAGSLILAFGGILDDKYTLTPVKSFLAPLLATLVVVAAGIGVPHLTNPLGGKIILSGVISGLFVASWLLGMIYTTKFLDGLDGLAASIGTVGALAIFAISFTPQVLQSYTAVLAITAAGAAAGFLIFNWHPAKIFLGEAGSTFLGFILGVLAIIAGGKTATAFLVMGIPILDVAWVIARRLISGNSPFRADRGHLHFRLLDLGLSQPKVVLIFVSVAVLFGGAAVFLQSFGKFLALLILFAGMVVLGALVSALSRRNRPAGRQGTSLD